MGWVNRFHIRESQAGEPIHFYATEGSCPDWSYSSKVKFHASRKALNHQRTLGFRFHCSLLKVQSYAKFDCGSSCTQYLPSDSFLLKLAQNH